MAYASASVSRTRAAVPVGKSPSSTIPCKPARMALRAGSAGSAPGLRTASVTMPRAAARVTNSGVYEVSSRQLMGVPERRSSDLASVPFHRAGTQPDGGATEASNGIPERSPPIGPRAASFFNFTPELWRRRRGEGPHGPQRRHDAICRAPAARRNRRAPTPRSQSSVRRPRERFV